MISSLKLRLLASILVCCFAQLTSVKAGTDFRLGLGIPLSTVVGSQTSTFGYGPGFEFIMDIQTEREASYFLNIDYVTVPGSAKEFSAGSGITLEPSVADWTVSGGAAYYPLRRKEGVTPVLAMETGFRFVTETVKQSDSFTGNSQTTTNSLVFENLSFALGAEFQIDKRLSLQAKTRINLNIPLSAASNTSFIYSNSQLNYILLQFMVTAEYRLSK